MRSDDIVLTLGTGGVSRIGLLLAKAASAQVVVTSSSDEKLAEMTELGADIAVNYRSLPMRTKCAIGASMPTSRSV